MADVYESVQIETKDRVAQVTLIGPGKGNAMGPAFWTELPQVFAALDADPEVRAIVLTGSGRNFSYGLDLAAMGDTLGPMMADGALAKPRADFHTHLKTMQGAITAVADCRTPTRRCQQHMPPQPRSPPIRPWWSMASKMSSTSSGPPRSRPACATWRRGTRRSWRPKT